MLKFKHIALLLLFAAALSSCKSLDCGCPMTDVEPAEQAARPS